MTGWNGDEGSPNVEPARIECDPDWLDTVPDRGAPMAYALIPFLVFLLIAWQAS